MLDAITLGATAVFCLLILCLSALFLMASRQQTIVDPALVGQLVEARATRNSRLVRGQIIAIIPRGLRIYLSIHTVEGTVLEAPLLGARLRRIHTTSAREES